MPDLNCASASWCACAGTDGACGLLAISASVAMRMMPMSNLRGLCRWGLEKLPQFRLIRIQLQRTLETLHRAGTVAGAGLRQAERGEAGGTGRRQLGRAPHVDDGAGAVARFHLVTPDKQQHFRIVRPRCRRLGEQADAAVDLAAALVADGAADQELAPFREIVRVGAHEERVGLVERVLR